MGDVIMPEECEYYYYDHDYCCRLLKNSGERYVLTSDDVHRYCWNYNYNDCPHYNNRSSGSGGCYLTSACVKAKGLGDDCDELTCLRNFRDNYLRNIENGQEEIDSYYAIAPEIVDRINQREDAQELWDSVYTELILPCVDYINSLENEKAYELYKNYTLKLKSELLL